MAIEAFETILKSLKGHGAYIYLHVKGEPMLHPQFNDILSLCEAYEMKVNLTTNGTLIGKNNGTILASKALRQMSISLQSQEDLASGDAFDAYMTHVLNLIEAGRRQTEIIFELRLWNYQGDMKDQGSDKNRKALNSIMTGLDVSEDTIRAIPQGKGIKLKDQVYLSKSLAFQWPDMALNPIGDQGTCYGLRQQVAILVNGDVVPCCLDGEGVISLGNIFERSFEEIVTSPRAQAMVKGFEERRIVEPLCMRCGYRERF